MESQIITILLSKDDNDILITFNGSEYSYIDLIGFYEDDAISLEENDYKEFLPGVFIRFNYTVHQFKKFIMNLISRLLKEIPNYVIAKLTKYPASIDIKIENQRDYIIIKQSEDEKSKILFKTDITKNKCAFYRINKYDRLAINTNEWEVVKKDRKEYIDPNKIVFYPNSVKTGSGCIFQSIFVTLGLLRYFTEKHYEIMTLEEILTTTAEQGKYREYCLKFEHCANLLKKFQQGTYSINYNDYDHVHLTEYNDLYFVSEGKHRVCITKCFKIPKLYAIVTTMERKIENEDKQERNLYSDLNRTIRRNSNQEVLKDYYNSLSRIGISKSQARYILEAGIYGADLIEYLESIWNKSLIDVYISHFK